MSGELLIGVWVIGVPLAVVLLPTLGSRYAAWRLARKRLKMRSAEALIGTGSASAVGSRLSSGLVRRSARCRSAVRSRTAWRSPA